MAIYRHKISYNIVFFKGNSIKTTIFHFYLIIYCDKTKIYLVYRIIVYNIFEYKSKIILPILIILLYYLLIILFIYFKYYVLL